MFVEVQHSLETVEESLVGILKKLIKWVERRH